MFAGLIEGREVVRGSYQTCLETIGTWTDDDGWILCGDCGIISV